MKLFIDSADIDEINKGFQWGVVDGVTTNPSLIKKAAEKHKVKDVKTYLIKLLELAPEVPVSLEVTKTDAKGMIEQGKSLYNMFKPHGNVNIKVPINPAFNESDDTHFDGVNAIKELTKQGIPVNCTLVFTPEQALLAAKAGAKFISPFAGRIDDYLREKAGIKYEKTDYFPAQGLEHNNGVLHDQGIISGVDLIDQCVYLMEAHGLDSQIIAASLRNTKQVRESAMVGAHIATVPFNVIKDMLKHQKTYEGVKAFTNDIIPEYEAML